MAVEVKLHQQGNSRNVSGDGYFWVNRAGSLQQSVILLHPGGIPVISYFCADDEMNAFVLVLFLILLYDDFDPSEKIYGHGPDGNLVEHWLAFS
mmetsp:Transcript_25990/g.34097  ORF Transcript_25990/g.34097 Transcript_25990/m.34097 type:complete len:94 (-) Transcript_25990:553-834(-)